MSMSTEMAGRAAGDPPRAVALDMRLLAMGLVLLAIWIAFGAATGGIFLTARNLFNLSLQVAVVGIMATGMVLIIVSRHIDLSVGSQIGFIGVVGGLIQTAILPVDGGATWWVASLAMLITGGVIGMMQGALIAYVGIPSFVVTLGGLMFFRNAAYFLNEGKTISPLNSTFQLLGGGLNGSIGPFWSWVLGILGVAIVAGMTVLARRRRERFGFPSRPLAVDAGIAVGWSVAIVGFVVVMNSYPQPQTNIPMGIPIPVLILLAVAFGMTALARKHRFGRHVFALGGSPESATLAGIDTRKLTMQLFVLMGLLCGLASIVVTARLNAAASVTGTMTELSVIAAAVIGGTSLAGGVGTILGGLLGALIMQSLESGMILMGVSTPLQKMVLAAVLILAVWIDMTYRKATRS
jgi:D-xylose transport system permease protein